MQDEHFRLLLDHFSEWKISRPSHIKAKLSRFSYNDGLLWHRLSPWDPLRIYVSHDTDVKLIILHKCYDAQSSGHLGREKTFLRVSEEFGGPNYIGGWPTIFALASSVSALSRHSLTVLHWRHCRYQPIARNRSVWTSCLACRLNIVGRRRGIIVESVDRANRIKCEINLVGGESSEMGPLARMMVSNGRVTENDFWSYADWST